MSVAPQPPEALDQSHSQHLSAREAERKIAAIDRVLDEFRLYAPLVAEGRVFTRPPITQHDPFALDQFLQRLNERKASIHRLKHNQKEYEDLFAIIDRDPQASVEQKVAVYMNALRAVAKALATGADEASIMELVAPQVQEHDAAIRAMDNWRRDSEDRLIAMRKLLKPSA